VRRPSLKQRVIGWSQKIKTPLGTRRAALGRCPAARSYRSISFYNTVFFLDSGSTKFVPYFKMNLVPFSEVLPFSGAVSHPQPREFWGRPILNAARRPLFFQSEKTSGPFPLVCYEIIYPGFVRGRLTNSTNLLVNVTNDGWFGKSSGPFQHAVMSRQRCIENGISLARCAKCGHQHAGGPVWQDTFQDAPQRAHTTFGKHFPVAGRYGLLAVGRLAGNPVVGACSFYGGFNGAEEADFVNSEYTTSLQLPGH